MSTAHTGKSARHGQSWLRRGAGMLVIPALCWAVMALACALAGTSLLTGVSSLRLFVRGLTYVLLLSFGVSINMHTGRFDFSTGAVMLLGGVCGALIAYGNGLGPWGMLLISIPTGAAAGCVSGLLYILLRLPPMIIGLGMTLVLEGIVAIITDGCRPVGFGTDASYYRFSVNMPAMLALGGVALILMVLLFHYTRFGYDYRALQTGQRIAVNTGVRERANALGCYTLSGALFGADGAIPLPFFQHFHLGPQRHHPHHQLFYHRLHVRLLSPAVFLRIHCEILQQTAGYPAWLYRLRIHPDRVRTAQLYNCRLHIGCIQGH